ncbi:hypothetical protein PYCCODRAFT_1041548 [Trametes coccinea BRFM310]|uniref:Uncharacterized protein n=1 Tax=Trametes coccinea (strain BRFM310) TaxID=1353009 RepID=A0A1Y2IA54_TRAC3|nr:hypothetical protein PYCCODRAFT_1041548 [Trametes coccinea BRFM310]
MNRAIARLGRTRDDFKRHSMRTAAVTYSPLCMIWRYSHLLASHCVREFRRWERSRRTFGIAVQLADSHWLLQLTCSLGAIIASFGMSNRCSHCARRGGRACGSWSARGGWIMALACARSEVRGRSRARAIIS